MRQWQLLQQRMIAEFKQKMRMQAAMFGIDIDGKKKKKYSKEEAVKALENPVADFPNDIEYFNEKDVKERLKHAEVFKRNCPNRQPPVTVWNTERADACLGDDVVAKRASMNDDLWVKYTELKSKGVALSVTALKRIVEFDALRAGLYPNTLQLSERHKYERKEKLPYTEIDPAKEPPEWFLKELRDTGELEKIAARLRSFCRGQDSVGRTGT